MQHGLLHPDAAGGVLRVDEDGAVVVVVARAHHRRVAVHRNGGAQFGGGQRGRRHRDAAVYPGRTALAEVVENLRKVAVAGVGADHVHAFADDRSPGAEAAAVGGVVGELVVRDPEGLEVQAQVGVVGRVVEIGVADAVVRGATLVGRTHQHAVAGHRHGAQVAVRTLCGGRGRGERGRLEEAAPVVRVDVDRAGRIGATVRPAGIKARAAEGTDRGAQAAATFVVGEAGQRRQVENVGACTVHDPDAPVGVFAAIQVVHRHRAGARCADENLAALDVELRAPLGAGQVAVGLTEDVLLRPRAHRHHPIGRRGTAGAEVEVGAAEGRGPAVAFEGGDGADGLVAHRHRDVGQPVAVGHAEAEVARGELVLHQVVEVVVD